MQCDICNSLGLGTIVPARQFRNAVKNGFNPFYNGCIPESMARLVDAEYPQRWSDSAMFGNTSQSDWNVCPRCMSKLAGYLDLYSDDSCITRQTKNPVSTPKECWFCSLRMPDEQSQINILMRLKSSWDKTEEVVIPRCSKCNQIHKIASVCGITISIGVWLSIVISLGICGGETGVFAGAIGVGPMPAWILGKLGNLAITRMAGVKRIAFAGLKKIQFL